MSEQATLLTRMRERRMSCWEQMKGISERAFEDKNRNVTAEERHQIDEWDNEISRIDTALQDIEAGEKRAAAFEQATSAILGQSPVAGVPGTATTPGMSYEQENEEFRKLINAPKGEGLDFAWPTTFERRTLGRGGVEMRA